MTSSEPQTGVKIGPHVSGHRHTATPFSSVKHNAPNEQTVLSHGSVNLIKETAFKFLVAVI